MAGDRQGGCRIRSSLVRGTGAWLRTAVEMAVSPSHEVIREDASDQNALSGAPRGDSHATCCDRSRREGIPSLRPGSGRPDLARRQDRHAPPATVLASSGSQSCDRNDNNAQASPKRDPRRCAGRWCSSEAFQTLPVLAAGREPSNGRPETVSAARAVRVPRPQAQQPCACDCTPSTDCHLCASSADNRLRQPAACSLTSRAPSPLQPEKTAFGRRPSLTARPPHSRARVPPSAGEAGAEARRRWSVTCSAGDARGDVMSERRGSRY